MITPTYRTQLQQVCEPWTQAPTARKSTGTTREAQVHTAQAKSPLDMNYEPLTAKWPERLRLLPWEEWKYPCRIQNESEMWKRRGRTHSSDVAVRSLQFTHILYMICFQIANHWHYGWRMIGTMWGPQVIRWFINLINYRYLRIINKLSYLGGLTLCVYIYICIHTIDRYQCRYEAAMKLHWLGTTVWRWSSKYEELPLLVAIYIEIHGQMGWEHSNLWIKQLRFIQHVLP